jgi:hypothetical protein
MKRIFTLLFVSLLTCSVFSQSGFLKKVANDVAGEMLGTTPGSNKAKNTQPEPQCACSKPEEILNLEGLNLMYSEITIDPMDDGSFIVKDRMSEQYYIVKDGMKKGPFSDSDSQVQGYLDAENSDEDPFLLKYKDYISKPGDKYLIKFNGKSYGPYARISSFAITKSKDKFAAVVVENEIVSQDRGKAMEEAIEKAKTDQEKMEIAMKFQQEMMQNMMSGGGPAAIAPMLVTNIEGADFNPATGGTLSATMKYDDILVNKFTQVTDLKGKQVISLKPENSGDEIFISSDNSKYASYTYGAITFSDGKALSDLFNPHLVKSEGKVSLAYMYYSPAKNSIMQCKVSF